MASRLESLVYSLAISKLISAIDTHTQKLQANANIVTDRYNNTGPFYNSTWKKVLPAEGIFAWTIIPLFIKFLDFPHISKHWLIAERTFQYAMIDYSGWTLLKFPPAPSPWHVMCTFDSSAHSAAAQTRFNLIIRTTVIWNFRANLNADISTIQYNAAQCTLALDLVNVRARGGS